MVYGASLSPCKISNLKIEIFPVCQETCSTALHRLVWPSRVLDGGEGMSYGLTRVYRTCSSCAIERMNQLRSMVKGATFMKRLGICLRWDSCSMTAGTQKCTACPSLAAAALEA